MDLSYFVKYSLQNRYDFICLLGMDRAEGDTTIVINRDIIKGIFL